jgi:hypothetical protein
MQDAAWAIVLFGGIPATLIFLFWWVCRRDRARAVVSTQYDIVPIRDGLHLT